MPRAILRILPEEPIGIICPELHGQFAEHLGACIEDGIWVGEDSAIPNVSGFRTDVLEAMRKLRPPVLRWPGGCYADDYHWEDGVGPRKDRPRRVNIWWGQDVESNAFGTHEFIQLCRYLGAEPYLAGNVGSGSVREMRDWVEYCNFAGDSTLARRRGQNGSPMAFNVKYWGVGNENWGCGGNFCPEDYAAQYKQFATYLRDFSGTGLFRIACGPDGNNAEWTTRFFKKLGNFPHIQGYAAHYYCGTAGPGATGFDVNQWYELLEKATRMENLILDQRALMNEFDPQQKIGLVVDEWGTWHYPTPGRNPLHLWQQSTMRDALVAAITLNIFNSHADKLVMANIAQMANVLQSMVLTEGGKMLLTPTYHVFDLYRQHQGATSLRVEIDSPTISFPVGADKRQMPAIMASGSLRGDRLLLTVVNCHASLPIEGKIDLRCSAIEVSSSVLTHGELDAHNSFDEPEVIVPVDGSCALDLNAVVFPPHSVTKLQIRVA